MFTELLQHLGFRKKIHHTIISSNPFVQAMTEEFAERNKMTVEEVMDIQSNTEFIPAAKCFKKED